MDRLKGCDATYKDCDKVEIVADKLSFYIRELCEEDLEQVCAMEEEAFSMPWKREDFVAMINNTNALYIVAVEGESGSASSENGSLVVSGGVKFAPHSMDKQVDSAIVAGCATLNERILGCVGCICVLDEGNICNIVVKNDMRGQGVGSALIKELIYRGFKDYGVTSFTLEVRESNSVARGLYEKCGFKFEGIRPGFYDFPKEDGAIYWLRNVGA